VKLTLQNTVIKEKRVSRCLILPDYFYFDLACTYVINSFPFSSGTAGGANGSAPPPFQPPPYGQFSHPAHQAHQAQQGSHAPHMSGNYYIHPPTNHPTSGHNHNSSVMVSPGGPGYNNFHHGNYYPNHNNSSSRPPYPPYGNQPHMPYNNGNYPSSYGDANGRHSAFNSHGSYQNQSSNQNLDFSRAISSSFSEGTTVKIKPSDSFQSNLFDTRDDLSIGAESDASWKQGLNQVASIEEDKFEARNGATTPVERICPTLSSDMLSPHQGLNRKKTSPRRSSRSLLQEPLDMSNSGKDDLDLSLCATGSGSLLFGDESSAMKRPREGRDDKSRSRNTTRSMNFHNLSMKEERDAPPPLKKNRCTSIAEGGELYSAFSIDSMNSFGREDTGLPDFGEVSTKANSKPATNRSPDCERDDCERDLPSSMPSWDITGQDSFGGGGFSVASNLTEGNADAVLGNSFSFSNDDDFPPPNRTESKGNPEDLDKIDPIANLNPSESIDLSRDPDLSRREPFPPNSETWVTNSSSQGGSFSMDSSSTPNQRFPPPPAGRFRSMPPPPYHDNRHPYPPPGPYGLPPRQPQSYLPSPFHPPPSGIAGPPMTRSAPQPVYMMSSAHGGNADGIGGMKRSISTHSNTGTFNWTKNDDTRLQDIMKKFKNPKDWESIAKEFGAGRT
jgi:hypothetical protein